MFFHRHNVFLCSNIESKLQLWEQVDFRHFLPRAVDNKVFRLFEILIQFMSDLAVPKTVGDSSMLYISKMMTSTSKFSTIDLISIAVSGKFTVAEVFSSANKRFYSYILNSMNRCKLNFFSGDYWTKNFIGRWIPYIILAARFRIRLSLPYTVSFGQIQMWMSVP